MSKCSTIECVPLIISYHIYFLRFSKVWSTVQKIKFFIKDFFSKCNQICRKQQIWSHLLKKSLMENFFFFVQWSILDHGSLGASSEEQMQLCVYIYLCGFFLLVCFFIFCQKSCVFIIFISFFDKASDFYNRELINKKPELVIRNCQWNCMLNAIYLY